MLKIDLHIHTVASGHAHSTILEYINRAKELKMKVIGFSDHGPSLECSLADEVYFKQAFRIPKVVNGIRVLKGAEANIINEEGEIDLPDPVLEKLDYVLAAFHFVTPYVDEGKEKNTKAMIKAIRSNRINILSHPFVIYDKCSYDLEKVAEEACKHDVLLEINTSYIKEHRLTEQLIHNIKLMLKIVRKNKKKVIVNSDSHNIWELGDDTALKKIQKKLKLEKELIINNYPEELFKLLKINE